MSGNLTVENYMSVIFVDVIIWDLTWVRRGWMWRTCLIECFKCGLKVVCEENHNEFIFLYRTFSVTLGEWSEEYGQHNKRMTSFKIVPQ